MNFAIPGRPITKKNSQRLVKRGKRMVPIPSARFWDYQERAGYFIPCKWAAIDTPVNIRCLDHMPALWQLRPDGKYTGQERLPDGK